MKIVLSGVLNRFAGYQREHELDATCVEQGLGQLTEKFPDLRNPLFDAHGKLRRVHCIYVNGTQKRFDELDEPVSTEDTVEVLTAIAGG